MATDVFVGPGEVVLFAGALLPASTSLTLSGSMEAVHATQLGPSGVVLARVRMRFAIMGAQLSGEVSPVDHGLSLEDLRSVLTRAVQLELDAVGLLNAAAFAVDVHHWFAGGRSVVFANFVPELCDERLPEGTREMLDRALVHSTLGPPLCVALNDLRAGVLDRDRTAMHCGRAVESLRQAFVSPAESTSRSWALMRETLLVSRQDLEAITVPSIPSRHGAMPYLAASERVSLLRRTREIVLTFARWAASADDPREG